MVTIGQRGRYFARRNAVCPVVLRQIIADAWCTNEASTAAIAIAVTVSAGVGVEYLKRCIGMLRIAY